MELYPLLKQLWLVWFLLLFSGILAWALWPSQKSRLQNHALIPLRDDDVSADVERKR